MTSRCSEAEDVANEFSYYNITKELEKQIFQTIKSLRNSKKQPNEDSVYWIISKTKKTKSLNKETLQETLNKPVNSKKVKVKYTTEKIRITQKMIPSPKDQIENFKDLFTSDHETPLRKITLKQQKVESL